MWRLRPVTFLPASNPCGSSAEPLFEHPSRSGAAERALAAAKDADRAAHRDEAALRAELGRSENACRYTEMSLREAIVAVIAGSAEANALVSAHAATHAHLLSLGAALSELPAAGLPHSGRNWNSLSRGAELTID